MYPEQKKGTISCALKYLKSLTYFFFLCLFFLRRFFRLCLAIFDRFLFFPLGIKSPPWFNLASNLRQL